MDSSRGNCKRICSEQPQHDRLSNLPIEILHQILSYLDTTEAVKTSLLSTDWRYIWTAVPHLNFDFRGFWKQEHCQMLSYDACLSKFWEFVRCAFVIRDRGTCPVYKLRVLCDYYEDEQLNLFFSLCAMRNVQEVDLLVGKDHQLCPYSNDPSGPVLGISQNFNGLANLETLKAFGNLKTLRFVKVRFRNAHISEKLFSDCGSLENLSMEYCSFQKITVLHISAGKLRKFKFFNKNVELFKGNWREFKGKLIVHTPNLVSFCYIGPLCQHWDFSDMPLLDRVQFQCESDSIARNPPDLRAIMSAIRCTKELSLSEPFPRYFSLGNERCTLDYLRCLKISMEGTPVQIEGLIKLLKLSPNLEVLSIKLEMRRFPWYYRGPIEGWRSRREDVLCLATHLKKIEISEFHDSPHLMGFVGFFLQNGKVLEKIKITLKKKALMNIRKFYALQDVWLASDAISVSVSGEMEALWFEYQKRKGKGKKRHVKKLKMISARSRIAALKLGGSS